MSTQFLFLFASTAQNIHDADAILPPTTTGRSIDVHDVGLDSLLFTFVKLGTELECVFMMPGVSWTEMDIFR